MAFLQNANWGIITFYLKAVIAGWSLLVLAVDAAFIAKFNSYFNYYAGYYYRGSGFSSANAVIACTIFNLLLFGAMIYFIKFKPESIFISMIVDTCVIGFLFLFNIGSVGSLTSIAGIIGGYDGRDSFWSIGSAAIGLGWIMVLMILALLIIEVTITLMHHGMSMDTWKTPFNVLVENGPRKTMPTTTNTGVVSEPTKEVPTATPVAATNPNTMV